MFLFGKSDGHVDRGRSGNRSEGARVDALPERIVFEVLRLIRRRGRFNRAKVIVMEIGHAPRADHART
jgi:hypothetical protein